MKKRDEYRRIYTLASLMLIYLWPMDKTIRTKKINFKPELAPAIYAVWHGKQYGLLSIVPRKDVHILISQSNDGESISVASTVLGFSTVRGSTNRGGTKALRDSLKILKNGKSIAFTVDGPKGPIYKVKEGVIKMAQIAQVPIIPIMPVAKRTLNFKTWDKYQLPYWFEKTVALYGDPIYVPRQLTPEEEENFRLGLENKLFELDKQAQTYL